MAQPQQFWVKGYSCNAQYCVQCVLEDKLHRLILLNNGSDPCFNSTANTVVSAPLIYSSTSDWSGQVGGGEGSRSDKLPSSDRRILLTHWVGDAVAKVYSDQLYRRRLFEKTGYAMTPDGTDDNSINLEGLDGPHTFMEANNDKEPREYEQPFPPADEEHPEGFSDEDDEEETGGDYNRRVRGSDDIAVLDDDDDLDAGQTTLPLECPPGYDLFRLAPPALDASLVKRHMLRRGLGWVKRFITRRAGTGAPGLQHGADRADPCHAQYKASTRYVPCYGRGRGGRFLGVTGGGNCAFKNASTCVIGGTAGRGQQAHRPRG